jgi:ABC-type transport system substrate-binding protein
VLVLAGLLLAGRLAADLAAQTQKKKEEEEEPAKTAPQKAKKPAKEEEEEEPAKSKSQQGKKPAKEEEEEPAKSKPRTPLRVGDENLDDEARPRPRRPRAQNIDLDREAQRALFPQVQELFRSLAKPHDTATMPSGKTHRIEPVAKYVGDHPDFSGSITLQEIDEKNEPTGKPFDVRKDDLRSIDPYEHIALTKVDQFIKGLADLPETGKGALTKLEGYQQAEKALQAVLNFHLSERLQEKRVGAAWDELKKQLESKLREVRLNQLHILAGGKDWDAAFDLGSFMAEQYRKDDVVLGEVAKLMANHADLALQAQDYIGARQRLLLLENLFPDSREAGPVRDRLRNSANEIVQRADALAQDKDTQAALVKLELAYRIYPELPGLRDKILQLSKRYPVLFVGVRHLPKFMSPATAITDSEKQAVELQFESLIKLVEMAPYGQRYELELAAQSPRQISLGRQFFLNRVLWSNNKELTATDVRHTVSLLCDKKWAGRDIEWADNLMSEGNGIRIGANQYQVRLTLSQGYLDPLSLMDFKILPRDLQRADDPGFAKSPIGSGPYQFDPGKSKPGEEIVFVANPHYGERPGKIGQPRIREIHFYKPQEPASDFNPDSPRPLGLLLDLTAKQYHALSTAPGVTLLDPMRNRRIYFLAVNHRNPPAKKNQKIRRAIGLAINRELILNQVFRDGAKNLHRPLTGPYPPDSWACDASLGRDPYNLKVAKGEGAQAASGAGDVKPVLSLKYPSDDPLAQRTCELIRDQVREAGIQLSLVGRQVYQLHEDVEVSHDYDLAYYSWDYANDAYWLWPLFDSRAIDGRNFLGYTGIDEQLDPPLETLFRKVMSHRDFATVQELTHQIHRQIYESMPIIPLWQLDTLVAIGNGLTFADDKTTTPWKIDPLSIFTDVEQWQLKR